MSLLITQGLGSEIAGSGVGTDVVPPSIVLSRSIDARTVEVLFNEAVVEDEALTAANYSIDGGLTVSAVVKVTSSIYRLTTSKQAVGDLYTVTVSDIHDLVGNLI